MADLPRTTNADLAIILGRIDTRLTVIEHTTTNLDKVLNGNGKPGLLEDYRCLENAVNKHFEEADAIKARASDDKKLEKEKRDLFSNRTWAIVLGIIMAFVSQTVGLIYLFVRTGAIK